MFAMKKDVLMEYYLRGKLVFKETLPHAEALRLGEVREFSLDKEKKMVSFVVEGGYKKASSNGQFDKLVEFDKVTCGALKMTATYEDMLELVNQDLARREQEEAQSEASNLVEFWREKYLGVATLLKLSQDEVVRLKEEITYKDEQLALLTRGLGGDSSMRGEDVHNLENPGVVLVDRVGSLDMEDLVMGDPTNEEE